MKKYISYNDIKNEYEMSDTPKCSFEVYIRRNYVPQYDNKTLDFLGYIKKPTGNQYGYKGVF